METLTGTVLEIQRMSTEDGPGIRSTVFLKGCTLACAWCHNPESIQPKPEVQWIGSRCIACRSCLGACPEHALSVGDKGISIARDLCRGCGLCVSACPGGALELLGSPWSADDLAYELAKDRAWFGAEGGVTVSGGEASMQADFTALLMEKLSALKIDTAFDTCGQASQVNFAKILPHSDLVLYDLKLIDSNEHRRWTGSSNEVILANLRFLAGYMKTHQRPGRLWIRTPIIPGVTATQENIMGIGSFIAENLSQAVERWELLAFNNLCRDKYVRLGKKWAFSETPLCGKDELATMLQAARESGVNPEIVTLTGSAALEQPGLSREEMKQRALTRRALVCSVNQEKLS